MFVLVLDCFFAVFVPFWYQRRKRVRVVLPLSLGAWILAFVVALVPVKGVLEATQLNVAVGAVILVKDATTSGPV